MSNSIQEALAAVQRKINEQRMKNSLTNHNSIQEDKPSTPTPKMPGTSGATMPGGNAMGTGFGLTGPTTTAGAVKPAAPGAAFKPTIGPGGKVSGDQLNQFRQTNPGATLGQYMNAAQGKTAIAGGKNDPSVIQKGYDATSGGRTRAYDPGAAPSATPTPAPAPSATPTPAPSATPTPAPSATPTPAPAPKQGPGEDWPVGTTQKDKPSFLAPAPAPAASAPAPAPAAPAPAPEKATSNFSSTVSDFLRRPAANINNWLGSSEEESGPSKGKKKMSESTLINSFLKLQETKAGNVFEAAKKMNKVCPKCGKSPCQCDGDPKKVEEEKELSPKQKKIAALAGDKDKLDAGDFAALRAKKSEKMKAYRADRDKHGEMEEEVEIEEAYLNQKGTGPSRQGYHDAGLFDKQTADNHATKHKGSVDQDASGKYLVKIKKKKMEEEVEFSDSELAHFASIAESAGAAPVDQGKANQKKLRAPQSERGIGETLPERDLTDEYNYKYMDEMARGVKAGQKRGSYKKKATDLKGNRVASADAEPDEGSKGVPHVLDQIRHGHEDEQGFKTITHPASSPEAPVTKRIHRSELHGFYDKYHNTDKPREKEKAYSEFLGKHFSDERATAPTHKTVTSDLSKVEKANLKGGAGKVSLGGSKLVGGRK